MPLGRAEILREDISGLYGEFRVSKTVAGDEALELVRDGALDGLSIGFEPVRDLWSEDRSSVGRQEVKLAEVSLVTFAAYPQAVVSAVRSAELDDLERRLAELTQTPPMGGTPFLPLELAKRRLAFATLEI